ncbi:MAG: carcinine hydrolase/isopenicillin-N N-acyltransferase family protein [Bacteroidota bacterium]
MIQRFLLLVIFIFSAYYQVNSCTSIIISGKYTKDGRPLMWKNRDTDFLKNKLMYFSDGKYKYIGLVNSVDTKGESVWIGYNEAGFAIMNTASYNINEPDDTTKLSDLEGRLMKQALQTCKNIEDFENLLNSLPKPTRLASNYGVIDANGGAAYFELGNFKIEKIDVNDPTIAPMGYVIRTNYSFEGTPDKGHGYFRYLTAEKLFYQASAENNLTEKFILQQVSQSLYHSLLDDDLKQNPPSEKNTKFVPFIDYIPRSGTSSATVICGVKKDENPEFTTMWAYLGFSLTSAVVPVWIKGGNKLPEIVLYDDKLEDAPLCYKALKLKELCFPVKRGHGKDYLKLNVLYNYQETGIMQKLIPVNDKLFEKTYKQLADWRKNGWSKKQVQEYYQWLDIYIQGEYKKLFGI